MAEQDGMTWEELEVILGKSDLIEVDGLFFCAFCRSYWARHMSFLHLYDDKSGTFGHSARLILVRYMMMLSDLQKVKKMESRHWDKHKSSLNSLPTEDIDNGVFGKETALKQSAHFFEKYESTLIDNAGRWVEPNLLPLATGGTSPTSWVFAQWLAEEDPPAELGEDILKYYDETHKCEIDLRELRKLLDDLPEGTRDEVWENNTLSKHRELTCEKIAFGMDVWAEDDAEALRYDIKSSMLLVKHHTQSTEAGVQEVARCSKGGRNERDASALSTLRSMHISPINQKIAQAYKEKKKLSGNQHQGPGVKGEREIRSGRAKVKEEEGSECRGRYDIPSKEKAKEIISVTLQSVPTEGSRKKVAAVMKKRKLGDDSAPCAKKVRTSQSQLRREEAEIAVVQQAATNKPISLAANVAPKNTRPPQYSNKHAIKSLNKKPLEGLTRRELEARIGTAGMEAQDLYNKGIRTLKDAMQDFEDNATCTCNPKLSRGPNCKCPKADYFNLIVTTSWYRRQCSFLPIYPNPSNGRENIDDLTAAKTY